MFVWQEDERPMVKGDWMNFRDARVSIFPVPKCGFSSVKRAVTRQVKPGEEGHDIITQKPLFDTRLWLCRHPVDRFKSMYANKILLRGLAPGNPGPWAEYGIKPEQVWLQVQFRYSRAVDSGEKRFADMHWMPQTYYRGVWGTESDILVPTSDLKHVFTNFPPQNVSRSEEVELSDKLRSEIEEFYQDDVLLYEQALRTDIADLPKITVHNTEDLPE